MHSFVELHIIIIERTTSQSAFPCKAFVTQMISVLMVVKKSMASEKLQKLLNYYYLDFIIPYCLHANIREDLPYNSRI